MSPSWTSQKTVSLVLSPAGIASAAPGRVPSFTPGQYASPVEAAAAAREGLEPKPNAKLSVVLGGAWGRCLLTPPLARLPARDDLDALARQTLAQTYGAQALDWLVQIQVQGPGLPAIVSAVEPAWLESLRQLAAHLKLELASVAPLLAAAWNLNRRRVPARAAWFALAEPGRVQLLALERGHWRGLASTRCEAEAGGLATLLHREAQWLDRAQPEHEVWLYSTQPSPTEIAPWRWKPLTPPPAQAFANLLGAA